MFYDTKEEVFAVLKRTWKPVQKVKIVSLRSQHIVFRQSSDYYMLFRKKIEIEFSGNLVGWNGSHHEIKRIVVNEIKRMVANGSF